MTVNLDSADHIAKLVLASGVIVSYLLDWITGRSALFLVILACVVIVSNVVRLIGKFYRQ